MGINWADCTQGRNSVSGGLQLEVTLWVWWIWQELRGPLRATCLNLKDQFPLYYLTQWNYSEFNLFWLFGIIVYARRERKGFSLFGLIRGRQNDKALIPRDLLRNTHRVCLLSSHVWSARGSAHCVRLCGSRGSCDSASPFLPAKEHSQPQIPHMTVRVSGCR